MLPPGVPGQCQSGLPAAHPVMHAEGPPLHPPAPAGDPCESCHREKSVQPAARSSDAAASANNATICSRYLDLHVQCMPPRRIIRAGCWLPHRCARLQMV